MQVLCEEFNIRICYVDVVAAATPAEAAEKQLVPMVTVMEPSRSNGAAAPIDPSHTLWIMLLSEIGERADGSLRVGHAQAVILLKQASLMDMNVDTDDGKMYALLPAATAGELITAWRSASGQLAAALHPWPVFCHALNA